MKTLIFITASLVLFASCQKEPKAYTPDTYLKVTTANDTIFSNSSMEMQVTIEMETYKPGVKLEITTIGGTINGSSSIAAFDPGAATIQRTFVATATNTTAYITVKIENTQISKTIPIVISSNSASDVLSLNLADTTNTLADEYSTFKVQATIQNTNATIATFTTNKGVFTNGLQSIAVPIDGPTISTTITASQEVSLHSITCTLNGNLSYSESIHFMPKISYPETIQLTPSAWTIDTTATSSNQAINLNCYLDKTNGKVSIGRTIQAKAYQMVSGSPVYFGSFTNLPLISSANEQCAFSYYTSTGLDENLPLFIEVETSNGTSTITQTISLDVTP